MVFGFLLWILFMFLTGMLAKNTGHSVVLWVILSFFFTWIPLLILVVIVLVENN